MRQLSDEFLECARRRLRTERSLKIEGELRRATSDLYFALFHAVCGALVEPFGYNAGTPGFRTAFLAIYRQADHGRMEKHARDAVQQAASFSDPLMAFAKQISAMKNKREQADYDPLAKINLSSVTNDLQTIETTLKRYWEAFPEERARFAVFLAIRR